MTSRRLGFYPRHFLPAHAGNGRVPFGSAGLLLSDVLFYSSKSGVKDGAVAPNFSAARFTALWKNILNIEDYERLMKQSDRRTVGTIEAISDELFSEFGNAVEAYAAEDEAGRS
ncbi:hypothetical protein [Rhizobium sp. L9]|uniref:hypothetical protein n=1 Tax=Rhizobium sp. L9 TaxID=1340738 RepID=UPI001FE23B0A|nr:hypothetical protein [Rhizobium sp. L9]